MLLLLRFILHKFTISIIIINYFITIITTIYFYTNYYSLHILIFFTFIITPNQSLIQYTHFWCIFDYPLRFLLLLCIISFTLYSCIIILLLNILFFSFISCCGHCSNLFNLYFICWIYVYFIKYSFVNHVLINIFSSIDSICVFH